MKNFWFIIMTVAASKSCTSPSATWLPLKNSGSGSPSIECPIEKYMSTIRNPSEAINLFKIFGDSVSLSESALASVCFSFPLTEAV